jgi:hypothetical protein
MEYICVSKTNFDILMFLRWDFDSRIGKEAGPRKQD